MYGDETKGLNWTSADLRKALDEIRKENVVPDIKSVRISPKENVTYGEVFDRMAHENRGGYLRKGVKSDIGERVASDIKSGDVILPQYNDKFEDRDEEVGTDHQIRRFLREDLRLIRHAEHVLIHDARICSVQRLIQIPSLLLEVDVVDVCSPDAGACTVVNDPARKYPGKGRALLPPAFRSPQTVPYVYDVLIIESYKCVEKIRMYRDSGHVGTTTVIYGSIDGNWERYTCDGDTVGQFDVTMPTDDGNLEIGVLSDLPEVFDDHVDIIEDGIIDDIRVWVEEEKEAPQDDRDPLIVPISYLIRQEQPVAPTADDFTKVHIVEKVEGQQVSDLARDVLIEKSVTENEIGGRSSMLIDYVEGRASPPLIPVVYRVRHLPRSRMYPVDLEKNGFWDPMDPNEQLATLNLPVTGRFLGLGEYGQCLGSHNMWAQIPYGRQGILELREGFAYLFLADEKGLPMEGGIQTYISRYRYRLNCDYGFCRARCVLSCSDGGVYLYELLDHALVGDRTAFMKRYAILEDLLGPSVHGDILPWRMVKWHESPALVLSGDSFSCLVNVRFDTPRQYRHTTYAVVPPSGLKMVSRGNRVLGPKQVARQWGICERTNRRWRGIINKYEVLAAIKFDHMQRFLGWPNDGFSSRFVSLAYLHYLWYDRPKRQSSFRRAIVRGPTNPYGELLRHRDRSLANEI